MNYKKIKIGIEIHKQGKNRLFSKVPIYEKREGNYDIFNKYKSKVLFKRKFDKHNIFYLGKIDYYDYFNLGEGFPIIENIDKDSLLKIILLSKEFNMKINKKIKFIRKEILDGSISKGYQLTSIISKLGKLNNSKIKIKEICLEEDSSKLLKINKNKKYYQIDRESISLVELITEPFIYEGNVSKILLSLGNSIEYYFCNRLGLGTIRQDINISLPNQEKIELKGIQNISQVDLVIENEIIRQKNILKIVKNLKDYKIYEKLKKIKFKLNLKKIINFEEILEYSFKKEVKENYLILYFKEESFLLIKNLIIYKKFIKGEVRKININNKTSFLRISKGENRLKKEVDLLEYDLKEILIEEENQNLKNKLIKEKFNNFNQEDISYYTLSKTIFKMGLFEEFKEFLYINLKIENKIIFKEIINLLNIKMKNIINKREVISNFLKANIV